MAKTLKVGGYKIAREPEEMVRVQEALRKALDRPTLHLKTHINGPALSVTLKPQPGMPEDESGGVLEVFNASGWTYWLSIALEFRVQAEEALFRNASLTIWRSPLRTEPPIRILRAEWELCEAGKDQVHAQPHWHVYMAELAATRSMERFHLAMATGWHLPEDGDSHYRPPTPNGIASWVRHCLLYTKSQLMSISRRS